MIARSHINAECKPIKVKRINASLGDAKTGFTDAPRIREIRSQCGWNDGA